MVSKATHAACEWMRRECPLVEHFYLESNFSTDKKTSYINTLRTRGKRVTAEATIPRDVLVEHMRTTPEQLRHQRNMSSTGAFLTGANNNGSHSANAVAALFIACGQDLGNVAESSAAISFVEVLEDGSYYLSITIPRAHRGDLWRRARACPRNTPASICWAAPRPAACISSPRSSAADRARGRPLALSPPWQPRNGSRATSGMGEIGRPGCKSIYHPYSIGLRSPTPGLTHSSHTQDLSMNLPIRTALYMAILALLLPGCFFLHRFQPSLRAGTSSRFRKWKRGVGGRRWRLVSRWRRNPRA